jgi:hypothetical protein
MILQFSVAPSVSGYIGIAAIPFGAAYGGAVHYWSDNIETLEQFPSTFAPVSGTRSLSLKLPWNGIMPYYPLAGGSTTSLSVQRMQCGYTVVLYCSPLTDASGGTPILNYALYVKPHNTVAKIVAPVTVVPQAGGIGDEMTPLTVPSVANAGIPDLSGDYRENNEGTMVVSVKTLMQRPSRRYIIPPSVVTATQNYPSITTALILDPFPFQSAGVTSYTNPSGYTPDNIAYVVLSDQYAFRGGTTDITAVVSPHIVDYTSTTLTPLPIRYWLPSIVTLHNQPSSGGDVRVAQWYNHYTSPVSSLVYALTASRYSSIPTNRSSRALAVDNGIPNSPVAVLRARIPYYHQYAMKWRTPVNLDTAQPTDPSKDSVAVVTVATCLQQITSTPTSLTHNLVADITWAHSDDLSLRSWRPHLGLQIPRALAVSIATNARAPYYIYPA